MKRGIPKMKPIEELLVGKLISKKMKIATAESCTGGLLSEMITRVPGSSAVFECGVCSYSNDIKMKVLGVKRSTIDTYTEVSIQCAAKDVVFAEKKNFDIDGCGDRIEIRKRCAEYCLEKAFLITGV